MTPSEPRCCIISVLWVTQLELSDPEIYATLRCILGRSRRRCQGFGCGSRAHQIPRLAGRGPRHHEKWHGANSTPMRRCLTRGCTYKEILRGDLCASVIAFLCVQTSNLQLCQSGWGRRASQLTLIQIDIFKRLGD